MRDEDNASEAAPHENAAADGDSQSRGAGKTASVGKKGEEASYTAKPTSSRTPSIYGDHDKHDHAGDPELITALAEHIEELNAEHYELNKQILALPKGRHGRDERNVLKHKADEIEQGMIEKRRRYRDLVKDLKAAYYDLLEMTRRSCQPPHHCFNATLTPFPRCFNAISTLFEGRDHVGGGRNPHRRPRGGG